MKCKKTMIASIILSCLSILMFIIMPSMEETIRERILEIIDEVTGFGLFIIINMLLLMYIDKLWTNVLYITLMTIFFINLFIMFLDLGIFHFTVGLQGLVYACGLSLIFPLTIILVITGIVKFVKSKINR